MSDPRDRRDGRDSRIAADKTVMYPGGFPPGFGPEKRSRMPAQVSGAANPTRKASDAGSVAAVGYSNQSQHSSAQRGSVLDPVQGLSHSSPQPMPPVQPIVRDHRSRQPNIEAMSLQGVAIQFPGQSKASVVDSNQQPSLGREHRGADGRKEQHSDELMAGVGHTVYEFSGQNSASVPVGDQSMQGINRDSNSRRDQTFYSEGSFAISVEERPHASNLRSGGAWKLFVPVVVLAVVGGLGWALMHDREDPGTESSIVSGDSNANSSDTAPDSKTKIPASDSKPPAQIPPGGVGAATDKKSGSNPASSNTTKSLKNADSSAKKTDLANSSPSKSSKKKSSKKKSKKKSIKPKSGPRPKRPAKKKMGGLDDLPEPD